MPVGVRAATVADLAAIDAIYNPYVLDSTCTMQLEPGTLEERRRWFDAHGPGFPVLIAELDGEIVGWGSLSEYAERRGYRFTAENSVYVRRDRHGKGIGRALLEVLIAAAKDAGHHSVIAKIGADSSASIALHTRLGFVEVGRLPEVGFKLGRWTDIVFLQLRLA